MTNCIGFRSTPHEVFYSIISENEDDVSILVVDKIVLPKPMDIPERLKFLRNTVLDILDEFSIDKACIRVTESQARRINIDRINHEAIIQELIASSGVTNYYVGQIANISSKLSIDRTNFKKFVSGELVYQEIDFWSDIDESKRESILASFSALNI